MRGFVPSILAFALLIAFALPSGAKARGVSGVFDYYTLALSWSPTYCNSNAGRRDNQQCGARRFAFVVHGLWPQYDRGWPQYCKAGKRYVPNWLIDETLPIMPSKRLVIHQWRKHGMCSGLSQKSYFALTAKLFEKVKVPARYLQPSKALLISPEMLRNDFMKSNLWLRPEMISVQCGGSKDRGVLRELRICFSKGGEPRACGDNERRQCRAKELVMPPVR